MRNKIDERIVKRKQYENKQNCAKLARPKAHQSKMENVYGRVFELTRMGVPG